MMDASRPFAFTAPVQVGLLGATVAGVTQGAFEDVRIWSVERTGAEIASARSAHVDAATPGLERLYRFDGSIGAVEDATGHSAATPLPSGATLAPSDAPVTAPPLPPVPSPLPGEDVTAYVYDTSMEDPLAFDDITLEFDVAGAGDILKRRWAHSDAVDEPVGFESYVSSSGVGSGVESSMYADRQGSIIWVTDPATGTVTAAYEYDAYGAITQTQGTLSQPYGYTGREYDAESGLYHYRARSYDPETGVFLQVDPIEFASGTMNLTAYAELSPHNFADPTGFVSSREFSDFSTSNAADSVGTITYVELGAISGAGAIAGALNEIGMSHLGIESGYAPGAPGFCGVLQYRILQTIVDNAQKDALHCVGMPGNIMNTPAGLTIRIQNLEKMQAFSRLALARHAINVTCFAGGDPGHQQAVTDALIGMEVCRSLIKYNTRKPPKS